MAKIFRQSDIEQMNAGDLTQDFVDYYNRLSTERQEKLASERPDLYEAVLNWANSAETEEEDVFDNGDTVKTVATEPEKKSEDKESDETKLLLEKIENNVYENADFKTLIKDNMLPYEALTIKDKPRRCPIHRIPLERYNITYRNNTGGFGIIFYLCPDCKRLYMEKSDVPQYHERLVKWNVPHTIYDFEISQKYIQSKVKPYKLDKNEKLLIAEPWIEERPICPEHKTLLEETACIRTHGKKSVEFNAYYCEDCQRYLIRRAASIDLEDRCAEEGVPLIEYDVFEKKIPEKKKVPKKDIKPDYYINEGKVEKYNFKEKADCFNLTESDTVVVSDSAYCSLEGHDTTTVLGLMWVKERKEGDRKTYLFMLGYCSECQKYYMDEADYETLYKLGRPEVTIISELDDSYMITSGEVFDIEKKHLGALESNVDSRMNDIKSSSDYVSQYATASGYDDGGLADAKRTSKDKYDASLETLYSYKDKPYKYRVDLSAEGKSAVYYIGSQDINLEGSDPVISSSSTLGRKLINYKTTKVKTNGTEYDIKLSREFDINKAALYGYANLRTDEDIVFRSGITDPFLVKVLNMRKKQHNLIDIFVTIQENQNSIVDVPAHKSIIVQGCAGSGKTMVLLHRLSTLKYEGKGFDIHKTLILTPNDQFNTHIKGLADDLQIGSVKRISVEQYYLESLLKYSDEFKPKNKIVSEAVVRQDFVDYIYSDLFRSDFEKSFASAMDEQNSLIEILNELCNQTNQESIGVDKSKYSEIIPQIKTSLSKIRKISQDRIRVKDDLEFEVLTLSERRDYLKERTESADKFIKDTVDNAVNIANAKIAPVIKRAEEEVSDANANLASLKESLSKIEKQFSAETKARRLAAVDKEIAKVEDDYKQKQDILRNYSELLDVAKTEASPLEKLSWMKGTSEEIPAVISDVKLCDRLYEDYQDKRKQHSDIEAKISAIKSHLSEDENPIYEKYMVDLSALNTSLSDLASRIETCSHNIDGERAKAVVDVNNNANQTLTSLSKELSNVAAEIKNYDEERRHVESAFFPFGKRQKLEKIDALVKNAEEKLEELKNQKNSLEKLLESYSKDFSDDKYVAWAEALKPFVPSVDKSLADLKASCNSRNSLTESLSSVTKQISEMKDSLGADKVRKFEQIALDINELSAPKAKALGKQNLAEEVFNKTVRESVNRAIDAITVLSNSQEVQVSSSSALVETLKQKRTAVEESFSLENKKKKIGSLENDISLEESRFSSSKDKFDGYCRILNLYNPELSVEDKIAWLKKTLDISDAVSSDIKVCFNTEKEIKQLTEEYSVIDSKIADANANLDLAKSNLFDNETMDMLSLLEDETDKYTITGIYQKVFDNAVKQYKHDNGVKTISGKCHRYDLYAQLLFSMKYFGKGMADYKFMCIDEGQDLAYNEYRLLYELNDYKVTFNIFGDVNQLIKQGRGIKDWNSLKDAFSTEYFTLNENYRNTNQITRFCNECFDMEVLQTGVDGPKVREISDRTLTDELESLSFTTERIAILIPRNIQKAKYIDRYSINAKTKKLISSEIEDGKIALMYVDEVKGIEFDKVFVVPNGMARNEKYIAYTRALYELIVVVDDRIASYTEIYEG